MSESTDVRRVYQYFNVKDGRPGQPFVLCDFHRKTYNPPALQDGSCDLRTLGDTSNDCELCKQST